MSFVRLGQGRRKRTFVRKKPIWDDSVSDLDAYRASPEEVRQRKESHKSKNHIAVKLEKMRKEKQRQCSGLTNVEARQVAIMKEVLHDQEQLESVLAKTDQMMAMVKDLFGDDAKKYRGVPNITVPPGDSKRPGNLMPFVPEIQTRTEKLSESVMSTSALNDLSETSDSEIEEQQPTPINFQSLMDIQRFQQFLYEEENRNTNAIPSSDLPSQADAQRLDQLRKFLADEAQRHLGAERVGAVGGKVENDNNQTLSSISGHGETHSHIGPQGHGPVHSTQLQASVSQGQQTPRRRENNSDQQTPKSALNDTGKVKKTKRKTESEISQNASSSFSMSDMRKVLESLQAEIADFELQTGRRPAAGAAQTETFSGYTIALVTAVTKLTYYLRETEKRLQMETMVREQLTQDVRQLAVTVDSLTSEVIMTQEEYGKLFGEHQRYRQHMQGELAMLHAQILDLKHQQSAQASHHSTPARAASAGLQNDEVNLGVNDHPSTAVLLSPIIRKTRVTDGVEAEHLKTKRQTSLVDIASLAQADGFMPGQEQVQTSAVAAKPLTVASMTSSSSSSSTVRSEPPQLTQVPPVMAKVSVPRPIPLVQSNMVVPLPGSQAAGPVNQMAQTLHQSMTTSGGASSEARMQQVGVTWLQAVPSRPRAMEEQIAELNRQHTEAQQRLQSLLDQQKRQHEQLNIFSTEDVISGQNIQETTKSAAASAVSPPISPISQRSEHFTSLKPLHHFANMSREIKVALPMVDLNVSDGSLNSP